MAQTELSSTSKARILILEVAALSLPESVRLRFLARFGGAMLDSILASAHGTSRFSLGISTILKHLQAAVEASAADVAQVHNAEAQRKHEMN